MNRILALVIVLQTCNFTSAQVLTPEERLFVVNLLEANTKKFLADIENVSDAQWNFKSADGKWSVGDVAEHIALSEDFLFSITQNILQAPADVEKAKTLEGREQQVLTILRDRTGKAQAPEMIRPSGKFTSKEELIEAFKRSREKTITYIQNTSDPLKHHVAPHPAVGDLTAYQWLVLIAGHAERHVAQLEEVKSDGNFPKL